MPHGSLAVRTALVPLLCTAMLADMADWGALNQEYVRAFTAHRPARSAFGTTGLALGARIELECTALAGPP